MHHRDEKIDLLRQLPLFADAPRRELHPLAATTDVVNVDAGRVLCRAGQRALETYIVVDGVVDVVVQGAALTSRRRGDIVGARDVLDGGRRSADVIAASDVTLLVIHASYLSGLLDTSPALRTALLRQDTAPVRTVDLEVELRSAA